MKYSIYDKLPIPIQNLACTYIGSINQIRRYGKYFSKYLELYLDSQWWEEEKLECYRDERISKFVKYCYKHVPYYTNLFNKLGINYNKIKEISDISDTLPVLTKNTIKENFSDFIPINIEIGKTINQHTSGTTGSGLIFPMTIEALQEQHAVYWRARANFGIDRKMLNGSFGGRLVVPSKQNRPPFWRSNHFGNQILFSGYHINNKTIKYYVEELNKNEIKWLHGYPSILSLIASSMLENSLKLEYNVDLITVGSENLTNYQSILIQDVFGTKPKQYYGTAEATGGAFECECGNLHIDEEYAAMELCSIGNNQFKILGTSFSNYAMPLIRYDTNDIVTVNQEPCQCGRKSRTIKNIDGRDEDYITLKNGTKIGRIDHIFKDIVGIREAQIRQYVEGEIEILIVKNKYYSTSQQRLLEQNINKYLGQIDFIIKYVDTIRKTKSGKLRFVISEVVSKN